MEPSPEGSITAILSNGKKAMWLLLVTLVTGEIQGAGLYVTQAGCFRMAMQIEALDKEVKETEGRSWIDPAPANIG